MGKKFKCHDCESDAKITVGRIHVCVKCAYRRLRENVLDSPLGVRLENNRNRRITRGISKTYAGNACPNDCFFLNVNGTCACLRETYESGACPFYSENNPYAEREEVN